MPKGDRDESRINKEEWRSQLGQPFIIALSRAINLGHSRAAQHNYSAGTCGAQQLATVTVLSEERRALAGRQPLEPGFVGLF